MFEKGKQNEIKEEEKKKKKLKSMLTSLEDT